MATYPQCRATLAVLAGLLLGATGSAAAQGTVSVRDFGAVGDGQTDDRPAIQSALDYAKSQGIATVYFDSGTYLLASSTSKDGVLAITEWTSGKTFSLSLSGNGATLITSQTGRPLLSGMGYWQNSSIQGFTFINTHGLPANSSMAISLQGGGQNAIRNWTIANNVFKNFSRQVDLTGVRGMSIANNQFLMENGRDSGTGPNNGVYPGTEPNVGIWMHNTTPNGTVVNITITGNQYDGCSTVTDLKTTVSQTCGDGLVYGVGSNVTVQDNRVKHFSFEGLFLQPDPTNGFSSRIVNNLVDGTAVSNDASGGGQWGIRCDSSYALVQGNTVINANTGIMIYGRDFTSNPVGAIIDGNTILLNSAYNQQFAAGIVVNDASQVTVSNNTIYLSPPLSVTGGEGTGIELTGSDGGSRPTDAVTVQNNTVVVRVGAKNGNMAGIFMQWLTNWTIQGNWFQGLTSGIHTLNLSASTKQLRDLSSQNSFVNNGAVIQTPSGPVQ